MKAPEGPPPVEHRWRIPLRVAAIVAGYLGYRFLERYHAPGAAIAATGATLLALVMIDRYTLWRRERLGLMQVGTTLLALGLIGVGLYLMAR